MANVGSLTVSLTALTGRFSAGMKRAAGEVGTFAASVGAASARLAAMSSAAAGVAATAIGYLIHKQAEAIDVTAKVADRLGESTEALLGMRYAADLAGVGAEEFDKAMEKLSKTLGNPTKDSADALDKIGLSSIALLKMSPAQRFSAIADGISKLGSQADKAAVATALFGKTGANLLNTMDLGSKGLAAANAEMMKLSGTFSRVDAAKVEEANDSITKLKTILAGVGDKLAIMAAPLITSVADHLISMGTDGQSAASKIVDAMGAVAKSLARVVDLVDVALAGFLALGGGALKAKGYLQVAGAYWRNAIDKYAPVARGPNGEEMPRESFSGEIQQRLEDGLAEAGKSANDAAAAFRAAKDKLSEAQSGVRSQGLIESLSTAYDKIVKAATGRAQASVSELASKRKAAQQAEVAASRVKFKDMVGKLTNGAQGFGQQLLNAGNGARLVDEVAGKISAFFHSLPERAIKAGYMPQVDLQTKVRGSFAGETAGRQAGAVSFQGKQIELSRQQLEQLSAIRASLSGGIAIP